MKAKKILASLLASAMVLGTMAVPVFAADPVAKIGNTTYETLQAAIDAAGTGDTITLTANVNNGTGIKIADGTTGKDITIDFSGHTYTMKNTPVGSTGTENQAMHFAKGNKLTLKNGTFNVSAPTTAGVKMMLQNYADLTLENITLNGTSITPTTYGESYKAPWNNRIRPLIGFNDGTVTINAGTVINGADKALVSVNLGDGTYKTDLTINDGTFLVDFVTEGATRNEGGSFTVNGGVFKSSPTAVLDWDEDTTHSYISGDSTEVAAPSGKYIVEKNSDAKHCEISGQQYTTLYHAVSAVKNDDTPTTITMIADVTCSFKGYCVTIAQNQSITIDLNGHTITGTATNDGASALFRVMGTLVINDTADGNGAIINDANPVDANDVPKYASNVISNYGTVTVNNGKVESKVSNKGYAQYPIDNYPGSTVNINGGKIITSDAGKYYALRAFMSSGTDAVNVNINGGEIYGGYGVWLQPTSDDNLKKVNFSMTGGYIHCKYGYSLFLGRDSGRMQGTVNISGGTIENAALAPEDGSDLATVITGDAEINGLALYRNSSVDISGGNIKGLDIYNSQVTITGGTFDSEVQPYIPTNYAEKEDNGTYTVMPMSKFMANVADAVTVKTATNKKEGTYEQVTAATFTVKESVSTQKFKVTATDASGDIVDDINGKIITLQDIMPGTNITSGSSVLCGIIIKDIPEGNVVTVTKAD